MDSSRRTWTIDPTAMRRTPRVPLAWLNLTSNRARMTLFAAGIGFAVVLMFVQYGCHNALLDSSVLLLKHLRADLVVVSRMQTTILMRTTFSRYLLARAAGVEGVTSAHPLYLEYAATLRDTHRDPEKRESTQNIRVVGVDPDARLLDFPQLDPDDPQSRVAQLHLEGHVLFDRLAKRGDRPDSTVYGPVEEGTTTDLAGRYAVVAGLFELGSDFGTYGTLIVSSETFRSYLRSRPPLVGLDHVDVGLIQLAQVADRRAVQRSLEALLGDEVDVLTKEEFMDREKRFWNDSTPVGYVFGFGVGMGFLVGLVICYQILSTDIRDNLPAYATLRAIGYPNRYLALVVVEEALLLAALGFLPGLLASWLVYLALADLTDLPMALTPGRVGWVFSLTVALCVLSGLLAVRQAQEADPAEVF
jgi:putative ABC transport system permease protein